MRYVLDTDIIIDRLRGFEKSNKIFDAVQKGDSVGIISVLTVAELFSGKICESENGRKPVEDIVKLFDHVDITIEIAKISGEFRRNYSINLQDAIIAATASYLNIPLITRNSKDFSKIKEIKIEIPY